MWRESRGRGGNEGVSEGWGGDRQASKDDADAVQIEHWKQMLRHHNCGNECKATACCTDKVPFCFDVAVLASCRVSYVSLSAAKWSYH